jgi:hypothetical protein
VKALAICFAVAVPWSFAAGVKLAQPEPVLVKSHPLVVPCTGGGMNGVAQQVK